MAAGEGLPVSALSGLFAECWLRAMPEEQTALEVDFLQKVLGVSAPARLLDVPCGGGRHSLVLAARGYQMTGVDLAPDCLGAARSEAGRRGLGVRWEQRDMRDLPWRGEFDGAFCFGNSLGYYDEDEESADFIKAVAGALKPGARFALDYPCLAEALLPSFQERTWYPIGDILFLRDGRYDHARGRIQTEYTCIRDGRMERTTITQRLFTYRELCAMLNSAGFTDVQGYGSLAGEPFRLGARRLLMVGTRLGG